MSSLVVVIVGEDWQALAAPEDNLHLKVESSKPLAEYADEFCKQMGISSLQDVVFYQGIGNLPDITPGDLLNFDNSPQDEGFVSPDMKDGDEQMCVVYAKRKEGGFNAVQAAQDIKDAVAGLGTNEAVVFGTLDKMQSAGDWEATVAAFKENHSSCSGGDLLQALKDDLSKSEMQRVEERLRELGVALASDGAEEVNGGEQPESGKQEGDLGAEASAANEAEDKQAVEAKEPDAQPEPEPESQPEPEPEREPEPEMPADTKCPDCDNDLSQPFCGLTGKPHVKPTPASNQNQNQNAREDPLAQFSTDRACTQCGDGQLEDDVRQAVFVCIDCDGKFCEVCWGYEHRNPKRSHHQQYLLYYECDICPAYGTKHAALWYCDACQLLLCKRCWWNEHKNPSRRGHYKQFLYPGGEDGPHRAATIDSQSVEVPASTFDMDQHGSFVRTPENRVCTVCSSAEGLAAVFECRECDPVSPELLCGTCWATEHRMPARRNHRKKLLAYPCDVCGDMEGRPAAVHCLQCQTRLCLSCWDTEHKNPERSGHPQSPLYADVDSDAQQELSNIALLAKALPTTMVLDPPEYGPVAGGALYPSDVGNGIGLGAPYASNGSNGVIRTPSASVQETPYMSPDRYDVPQQQYDTFGGGTTSMSPQQEADRFFHYRKRLARFYQVYNPSKLPSVASCLKEYKGYEEDLMAALVRRYGPEPEIDYEPLPYGWRLVESTRGDLFYIHTDGRKQWQRPVV